MPPEAPKLGGEPLTGHWFSRSQEYAARRRGEDFDPLEYATPETVALSPLPCWEYLLPEEYRERIRGLVEEIEEDAAAARDRTGIPALGPDAILTQDPQHRPEKSPSPPLPLCTPRPKPPAWRSTSPIPGSSGPSVRRPRSSDEEIATSVSRPVASRRLCLSCLGREGT